MTAANSTWAYDAHDQLLDDLAEARAILMEICITEGADQRRAINKARDLLNLPAPPQPSGSQVDEN